MKLSRRSIVSIAFWRHLLYWISLCAPFALGQIARFSPPGQNGIVYSVNIPQLTATSGSGPIYIQLKASVELEWFALGQGNRMKGANIFVVYSSGNNVSVSPRLGVVEHVQPLYNPQAQLSVLDESGFNDGILTANIRCDSCITWPGGSEDVSSSSSPWVWAAKFGPPLDSSSLSANIIQHDIYGVVSLNLKDATGGTSDNPFSSSSSYRPSSSGSTSIISTVNEASVKRRRIAHAVIMILVFVVLFPTFALTLHLFPSSKTVTYIHAPFQLFTLALAIAGFGIGVSLARTLGLTGFYHQITGYVVISCLVIFQPAMGLFQHLHFRKTGKKSTFSYLHRWLGRTLIILGMINGGLGFRLTGVGTSIAPTGAVIAYGVVAGIMGVAYICIVIWPIGKAFREQHAWHGDIQNGNKRRT